VTAHPEYSITVLLRNPQPSFSEKYPNVKVLKGDFESFDLLKDAASKADIVVRTSFHTHSPMQPMPCSTEKGGELAS
jgi:hypothetical protein